MCLILQYVQAVDGVETDARNAAGMIKRTRGTNTSQGLRVLLLPWFRGRSRTMNLLTFRRGRVLYPDFA